MTESIASLFVAVVGVLITTTSIAIAGDVASGGGSVGMLTAMFILFTGFIFGSAVVKYAQVMGRWGMNE